MKVTELEIPGLRLIQLDVHGDARGFFVERFNRERYREHGLPVDFVQDNHSRSAPGVVRGLHFQYDPPQGKLVGCVGGKIWDVVVDVRAGSPTFGRHCGVELDGVSGKLLWVPPGFAHGFCVLGTEPADILYKVTSLYTPSGERGILWNDPELGIHWPLSQPVVSERDRKLETFAQYRADPVF